jgi:UPF0755 protein
LKAESRKQKAESRKQKAESRKQKLRQNKQKLSRKGTMKIQFISKIIIVMCVLFVAILLGSFWRISAVSQTPLVAPNVQYFAVKKGANITSVLRDLSEQGVIESTFWQRLWIKSNPTLSNIQQGWYQLSTGMTLLDFVQNLHAGKVVEHKITLIEGFTVWQWLEQMAATGNIIIDVSYQHNAFQYQLTLPSDITAIENTALVDTTGDYATKNTSQNHPVINNSPWQILEGYFAPDTYFYTHQAKASDILLEAYARQRKQLKELLAEYPLPHLIQNERELLTLASIVEKETGQAQERPIIAGVFLSRLAKEMRLQTDPTIIYGIGPSFNGDITYADLRAKTPYNTYRINGLTPSPIANPSLASIQAVLAPEITGALYFVARGDGTHEFTKTLAEHNKAVKKYQLTKQ